MADARGPHPDLDPNVWSSIRDQIEAAESATPVPASLTTAAIPKVMSSSRVEEDLGISIAIDGDTVVVGARRAFRDVVGDIAGAAYVFERDSTAVDPWRLVKRLVGSAIDDSDSFGTGVAISGDTIIIGAPNAAGGFGAVYVFYRDEGGTGNWGEVTAVTPVTANLYGGFGDAVALDGDVAIVGSPFDSGSATQAGSAFLLGRNQDGADSWGVITKILSLIHISEPTRH